MCQELGWLVNIEKSELDPRQVFDFVGYQFDLKSGRVRPTPDRWQTLQQKIQTLLSRPACLVRQFIVLDRSANSHREASSPRPATHEAYSMASQKQLEGSGITRKGLSHPQISASQSEVVAGGRQFTSRPTITPSKALCANLYRCIKRRVGWSLKWAYCKRNLVPSRKQAAYKLSRTKSNLPSIKRVSRPLLWQDSSYSNWQHHSGVIHKQGRRHEIGPSLCPTVENLDLVYQEAGVTTYSRPAECGSRQTIQARPDHPDPVVSPSRGFPSNMQQVALASNRSICHEVQQEVTSVCVTSTGSPGLSSWCSEPNMGGSRCLCFPPAVIFGKWWRSCRAAHARESFWSLQGGPTCLLVSSGHVQPNPIEPIQPAQPANTALQSDAS